MIRTMFALATGGALGLGLIFQEPETEVQEKQEEQKIVIQAVDEIKEVAGELKKLKLEELGQLKEGKAVVVVELASQLAELAKEREFMAKEVGQDHPKLKELKAQVEVLAAMLKELNLEGLEEELAEVAEASEEIQVVINGEIQEAIADGISEEKAIVIRAAKEQAEATRVMV